ncbi:hypothetical protein, partial [Bifidobacterium biavatii]
MADKANAKQVAAGTADVHIARLSNGALAGVLAALDKDPRFHALAAGEVEPYVDKDTDPTITVGAPEGIRP